MRCVDCGGTFFYKVSVEQFGAGGYGSAQFTSLTMQPETAYICLCGHPVEPTERAVANPDSMHSRFVNAVHGAVDLSQKRGKQFQLLAAQTASVDEAAQLRTDVKWLVDALEIIEERLGALEDSRVTTIVEDDDGEEPNHEPAEQVNNTPPVDASTDAIGDGKPEQISKSQQKAGRRASVKDKAAADVPTA